MAEAIKGFATEAGTRRFRERHVQTSQEGHFRSLQSSHVSSVGIGTYLGRDDDATDVSYQEAIALALERGLNVIDTAINYRNQRSERAVGRALYRAIVEDQWIARDEILVATKGGFLPFDGSRPNNAREYFEETYVRSGILRFEDVVGGCHAISPRFLSDQIDRSRRNLGLATVDIYYVHNVEMALDEVPRAELERRLRAAFACLEEAVAEGRIRMYGAATWNGFRVDPSDGGHLSLERMLALAREVGGEGHHFRAVQLPYNLVMDEAARAPTQTRNGGRAPFLEVAEGQVYVMTSASILQGRLAGELPPGFKPTRSDLRSSAQQALEVVRTTPGVGTALVGMKQAKHVLEITRVIERA